MHHSKYTLYNWKHRFLKLVNDNIAIKNVHQHCQQLESNFTTTKFKTILSKKNVFVVSKRQQNTLSPNPENIIDNSNRENIIKKASYKTAFSNGPGLKDFLSESTIDHSCLISDNAPYLSPLDGNKQNVFLEIYGCQMNVNDAEIVSSILIKNNYEITKNIEKANIILLVTCAIREKAEHKIWSRLLHLRNLKKKDPNLKIGLLGCMAERLKHKIVEEEKIVNIVAGPDSYKDLPRLLQTSNDKEVAINVQLSMDETYADVSPVRLNSESKTAFVSIMRGCDNMCTYCIVPFTRGRERSRPMESILNEVQELSDKGIKEITLLGQNVNSYRDLSQSNFYQYTKAKTNLSKGFKTVYKNKEGGSRFSDLLDNVSKINPEMRIRFTSPHPKDFPDEVLGLIAERRNICQQIHLPAQSGSSTVLSRMRRGYTREAYLELVDHIRSILPEVMLSSDFIVGFCDETADEFEQTLSLMNEVDYSSAYLFAYSMREKTTAHRRYTDNVDKTIKLERLQRLVQLYRSKVESLYKRQIGQYQLVLVEGVSKKGAHDLQGRNDGNIKVIIPNTSIPESRDSPSCRLIKSGDYVVVNINYANSQILKGIPMYHSSIRNFNCIYK